MESNNFGLSSEIVKNINTIFGAYPKITEVIIFGSRAKESYRYNSDIDLAIKATNFSLTQLQDIEVKIENLYLPYTVDVLDYSKIENQDLISHIDRIGKIFYKKQRR
ncbi:MAG: nucleotidyltransferase family protein [Flavobacteriaceae bacterium]